MFQFSPQNFFCFFELDLSIFWQISSGSVYVELYHAYGGAYAFWTDFFAAHNAGDGFGIFCEDVFRGIRCYRFDGLHPFFVLGTSLPLPDFSGPVVLHISLVLVHAHNLV